MIFLGIPNDYIAGCLFIEQKYLEVDKQQQQPRAIFHHKTCATDSGNMEFVFEICFRAVLEQNLGRLGYS